MVTAYAKLAVKKLSDAHPVLRPLIRRVARRLKKRKSEQEKARLRLRKKERHKKNVRIKKFMRHPPERWAQDFRALVTFMQEKGYSFASLNDAPPKGAEGKTAYLRYDVHLYDIAAAQELARLHEQLKIPGVFYLNWDYTQRHDGFRDQYNALKNHDPAHVQFGFHAAPLASWYFQEKFAGDHAKAAAFINSDGFADFVREFERQYAEQGEQCPLYREFVAGGEACLKATAKFFLEAFPGASTVNGHGNILSSRFLQLASRDGKYAGLRDLFTPARFLTPARIEPLGFHTETTFVGQGLVQYDGAPRAEYIDRLCWKIRKKQPCVFLFHPKKWSDGAFAGFFRGDDCVRQAIRRPMTDIMRFGKNETAETQKEPAGEPVPELDLDKVIFIMGFTRGGTAWLRRAIGTHPDIEQLSKEINFNVVKNERGLTPDIIRESLLEHLDEKTLAAKRIVTKAPANARVFDEMAAMLPDSKFIFIVRDPRDVYNSHQQGTQDWMKSGQNETQEGCMTKLERFFNHYEKAKNLPNVTLVQYENLHQNFPGEFERLCRFMEARVTPDIIAQSTRRASFQQLTGREHHEERPELGARKGVIGDGMVNLGPQELAWYRKSMFWAAFMDRFGYGWETMSLKNLEKNLKSAGVALRVTRGGDAPETGCLIEESHGTLSLTRAPNAFDIRKPETYRAMKGETLTLLIRSENLPSDKPLSVGYRSNFEECTT